MNEILSGKAPVFWWVRQIAIRILLLTIFLSSALIPSIRMVNALSTHEMVSQLPLQINFNTYTPTPFGSEDINPIMTILEGGNTLHLKGNSWKKISLPYPVTSYTVVEFDFKSPVRGENHGLGFENDQTKTEAYMFSLYGTDGWGNDLLYYQYDGYATDWRHYRIAVGEKYTGNRIYLVFMNDEDVSNPVAESYFSNVQVFEDPSLPAQPPVGEIDFNNYTISPYTSQDTLLTRTIGENGDTLHMQGNGWLKMNLPYTLTESTVVEFDFKSPVQGEIHGIGFDTNNAEQAGYTFQLYGTQDWDTLDAFQSSLYASDWKHYRIPVGKYYTGEMRYLFFANDHDVTNPTVEGYFRNVSIYEGELPLPVSVDFDQHVLAPYISTEGGSTPPTIAVEGDGSILHLSGNGWTQISMPILVSQTTVLEFDFMSNSQGEVHGIGMDDDQSSDLTHTFKLYGTQNYGNLVFYDYAPSAPNSKHYVIPVGQYYTGQMLYLFFANDHDVASPTAESYFSNVQIHTSSPPPPTNTYDRTAAIAYADDWAYGRNPVYPFWYGTGCDCNDCTNYISQVLHNGRLGLRPGGYDEDEVTEWWYRTALLNASKTWSVTNWLYDYARVYDTEFDVEADLEDLEGGDFILLDFRNNNYSGGFPDGKPDHGRVVVGYGDTSIDPADYTCIPEEEIPTQVQHNVLLVNQHCVDRKHVAWNFRIEDVQTFFVHVTK